MPDSQTPNIFEGSDQEQKGTIPSLENQTPINSNSPTAEIVDDSREKVSPVVPNVTAETRVQPSTENINTPLSQELPKPALGQDPNESKEIEMEIDANEQDNETEVQNSPQTVLAEKPTEVAPTTSLNNESPQTPVAKELPATKDPVQAEKINNLSPNQKLMSALAYMSIAVMVPINISKKDDYVDFHVRQGLALVALDFATMIILGILLRILPRILGDLLMFMVVIALFALHGMMILKAISGEKWSIPNLGESIQKINIDKFRPKPVKTTPPASTTNTNAPANPVPASASQETPNQMTATPPAPSNTPNNPDQNQAQS